MIDQEKALKPGTFLDLQQDTGNLLPPLAEVKQENVGIYEPFVKEYEVLKAKLNLKDPVISYPACGYDISLSAVFPKSHTYYVDVYQEAVEALKRADLPEETTHIIAQSAYDYEPPEPIDFVVLRNSTTDKYDTVGLVKGLKKGGYVIESHWGSSIGSRDLLADPNFDLVGRFIADKKDKSRTILDTNVNKIAQKLANDTDIISKQAGSGYVFRKKF